MTTPAPVPALPDTERRTAYTIAAQTGPFAVNFAIYGDGTDYAEWVEVWLNSVKLDPATAFTLTSPSGNVSSLARPITDAVITLAVAGTGNLQIVGARRPRRTSQFTENSGVTARDINQVVTDGVAQLREIWDRMSSRMFAVPPGETVTQLPAATSRASKILGFDINGDTQMIALVGSGFVATSTTSLLISVASKSFTTQAGTAFRAGQYVRLISAANSANYMEGIITSYSGTAMVVNVLRIGPTASGTFADWSIAIAGTPGAGDLLSSQNLADVANITTARKNLGIGQISLNFFGGVGDNVTNNDAAVAAAEASAFSQIFVPDGTYVTTKNFYNTTDITKQYQGPGAIKDSAGHKRGKWSAPWARPINATITSLPGDHTQWTNTDEAQAAIVLEQIITAPLQQTGTLVTNSTTAAGNAVLHFASVPSYVSVGANGARALSITGSGVPAGATVLSATGTTVTMSANATGGGVASGASIGFGVGQFFQPFEASTVQIYSYAAPGTLNNGQTANSAGQGVSPIFIHCKNSAGGGGMGGIFVRMNVDQPFSLLNPATPSFNAAGGILGGHVEANADSVFLNPLEYEIADNGHPAWAYGLILDLSRTVGPSANNEEWCAILLNGPSSAPVDRWMKASSIQFKLGIDFACSSCTWVTNPGAAIVLPQDVGIYFNATATSNGASSAGNTIQWFDSATSKLKTRVLGVDALAIDGSGILQMLAVGSMSANGAIATTMTSLGPTGSHTTIQEWLTIKNRSGVTRYIPCY